MAVFEIVIALLFVGAVLSALARRINIPYPALLALAGAALALVPGVPVVNISADLALTLFVAPVLLDAAFDSSPRDLKQNWRAVLSLALVAVGLTVVAVAAVVRLLAPELPWSAAIALGAIVAPPDAAAATAVLRQLRLPHRVLVVLEGESLFNDASALLIYRLAVGATLTGAFSGWSALPMLAAVCAGSVVLGWALSFVIQATVTRVSDVSTSVILQFLSTFAVWMLAEALHLSGIITLVVYAIAVARKAPALMPARLRIPSYAVWEVAVFVLNVLAFIIVGLQLKPIVAGLDGRQLVEYLVTAGAVCLAVIGVRIVWVMVYHTSATWLRRLTHDRRGQARIPSRNAAVLIAWCGMRGIVTLAAALALPAGFPGRDLILFTAFAVVLVTLVVQGLSLTPLIRRLRLEDDGTVDDEVRQARAAMARAGFAEVDRADRDHEMLTFLHKKYAARLARAENGGEAAGDGLDGMYALQRDAMRAERRALTDLRARGIIGDDAFHKAEEELDWAEVNVEAMTRDEPE